MYAFKTGGQLNAEAIVAIPAIKTRDGGAPAVRLLASQVLGVNGVEATDKFHRPS